MAAPTRGSAARDTPGPTDAWALPGVIHARVHRPAIRDQEAQLGGSKQKIDFDRVEEELILPALNSIGIEGGTTTEIVEQGNIREDMFRLLVTAELVIADVSIHNANVFYELGIRHGLRAQDTFLLRANIDKYPFDLATDSAISSTRRRSRPRRSRSSRER